MNKLKLLRKEKSAKEGKRVTQQDVATAIGVMRSTISEWETNDCCVPSRESLDKLAEYYGVTVSSILDIPENTTLGSPKENRHKDLCYLFDRLPYEIQNSIMKQLRYMVNININS